MSQACEDFAWRVGRNGCSRSDAGLSVVVMPLVRNDLKHSPPREDLLARMTAVAPVAAPPSREATPR